MKKLTLEFNSDFNTVSEVKDAAQILRSLIHRRDHLQRCAFDDECVGIDEDSLADRFWDSFQTLTQNVEVK